MSATNVFNLRQKSQFMQFPRGFARIRQLKSCQWSVFRLQLSLNWIAKWSKTCQKSQNEYNSIQSRVFFFIVRFIHGQKCLNVYRRICSLHVFSVNLLDFLCTNQCDFILYDYCLKDSRCRITREKESRVFHMECRVSFRYTKRITKKKMSRLKQTSYARRRRTDTDSW